ncbi:MAG: Uma2 family endonuclease [Selenomonadaceae bacterium]|nr:Uma2 family endonuclease [Selenomonadaceae bacterium]
MEMPENLAYDYDQYADEPDYELIGGEKFFMAAAAPRISHGTIVGKLYFTFTNYIIKNNVEAAVFGDNTDVYLSDEYHCKPDLSVICNLKLIENDKYIDGVPDLIIEVLSESTMKNDLGVKKDAYEKHGVKEYWIVDPWSQRVDVYLLADGKFTSGGIYKVHNEDTELKNEIKVSIFEDLTIDLRTIFKRWFEH